MLLSIIIPAYNEEKRIGKTLTAISEFIKNQPADFPHTFEVIVVNNGSTDDTYKIAASFNDDVPNLQILNENSHGKGWAVKQGMLAAQGDYRLCTDADNSTDIHYLEKLLTAAQEGYDIVISSRRMTLSHIMHRQPWYREILGNVFAGIVRLIVPLGVKDTQNGFKLFSKEAAEKIFPHQSIFYWAWDVEVLGIAKKFGFKIKEVPITWINDEQSKMNIKGMVRMLFEVMSIRISLWTRVYRKEAKEFRDMRRAEHLANSTPRTSKVKRITRATHRAALHHSS